MQAPAWQSLAELEQAWGSDALASVPAPQQRPQWLGTSLAIAGVPLLVGSGDIEEIVETPPVMSIPRTRPWVMGVGSHMGGLLPIVSGDVLFRRRPYTGRRRDYCMVLRRQGFQFGLTLSEVERDLKFPLEEHVSGIEVDPDFAPYTNGGFRDRDRFLPILDIERLLATGELADAALDPAKPIEDMSDEH